MSTLSIDCWGEDRAFAFEPSKTALLVIDMQRHFLEPIGVENDPAQSSTNQEDSVEPTSLDSSLSNVELATQVEEEDELVDMSEIVPRVRRLLDHARKIGCHVVHTREGYQADLSDVSSFRRELDYVGHDGPLGRSLIRGEPGHDFVSELQPLEHELVIDKASFGAFFQTDLDTHLRAAGVTHLILCGVTTQCCVHSTLREAVDLGYWCLTVADCCAAAEPALHEAALLLIVGEGHLFGWISDLSDVEISGPAIPVAS